MDGTAVLSMTVRGTEELPTWVMSMAPWVEVLKPDSLRGRVKEMLTRGACALRVRCFVNAHANGCPGTGVRLAACL